MKTSIADGCPEWTAGNGSLLLLIGANASLRVGGYGETFFTADCHNNGVFWEAYRQDGLLHVHLYGEERPADPALRRSAVKTVFYTDGAAPVLAVGVAASHDLLFRIRLGKSVRATVFDRIASALGGIPCLKLTAPSGRSLYVVSEGNVTFDPEAMTLFFTLGQSRLVFFCPEEDTDIDALVRLYERVIPPAFLKDLPHDRLYARGLERKNAVFRRLSSPNGNVLVKEEPLTYMREELYARQSREGGFFLREGAVPLAEQCALVPFLCADRNRLQAEAFLSYLDGLVSRYGRLPYACAADGQTEAVAEDPFGGTAVAVLLALDAYARRFGLSEELPLARLAARAAEDCLPALRGGMMPLGHEASPAVLRFYGSAVATIRFLKAGRAALSLGGDAMGRTSRFRLASAIDHAEAAFAKNFSEGGVWYETAPKREDGMKHPSHLSGRCGACGRFGHLTRKGRDYLCETCPPTDRKEPFLRSSIDPRELALTSSVLGLTLLPLPHEEGLPEVGIASDDRLMNTALCCSYSLKTRGEAAEELLRRYDKEPLSLIRQSRILAVCLAVAEEIQYQSKKEAKGKC